MTFENAAPAGMPGVEEIARAIAAARKARTGGAPELVAYAGLDRSDDVDHRCARAILALFAPILAEKERLEDELEGMDWHAVEAGRQRDVWKARALAAEAALAAERERCAKIAENPEHTLDWRARAAIAAAIRAQGE